MTGIEIAVVVIIIVVGVTAVAAAVAGAILLGQWLLDRQRKRPRRVEFEIVDVSLQATRDVVLVGQNTDIRFFFTIKNPRRVPLRYEADVKVQDLPDVQPQVNTFSATHFKTVMPRLHCSWGSTGSKQVTATLFVFRGNAPRHAAEAKAMGPIEVVAELEEHEHHH